MTPSDLLVIGEALIDRVSARGAETDQVGGSPANVARGLASLGHRVELATWVGLDAEGRQVAGELAAIGVRLTPGSTAASRTLTARATLDELGRPTYEFLGEWGLPDLAGLAPAHTHLGSVSALLQPGSSAVLAFAERVRPQTTISYDPNLRPTLLGNPGDYRQVVEQLVGLSDVVKVSAEDVAWLYDGATLAEVLPLFARLGPALIVGTDGGAPAHVIGARWDAPVLMPQVSVTVVDTIGAGDAFMAGLISGLLDTSLLAGPGDPVGSFGQPAARLALDRATPAELAPALQRAAACAAYTVAHTGAAVATRHDLGEPMAR